MSLTDAEKEKLFWRRQFILGPHFIDHLSTWKKLVVNNTLFLTAHPELEITQVAHNGKCLTLIGYILDPYNPSSNNLDICNRLVRQIVSAEDAFQKMDHLGGRFVVLLNVEGDMRLFTDAIGYRSVYFLRDSTRILWCASQPGAIAQQLGLELNRDTWNEFLDSGHFRSNPEYWYPGDSSPFKKILHLLPNHYLSFENGEVVRYWPRKRIDSISIEECIEQASDLLKRLMKSANHRLELALSLTAGYDTRLLLAACKEISKEIVIFTQIHPGIDTSHMDIWVPDAILSKLGLKHTLVTCPQKIDDDFLECYEQNVSTGRLSRALSMYGQYKYWGSSGKVLILGSGGEIFRCIFGNRWKYSGDNSRVSAKTLAKLAGMKDNTFAVNQFENWRSKTKSIPEDYGINILDLFVWEQGEANWGSMNQAEADIAHESFFPYNCHRLLTILLSAEQKYRMPPKHELIRRLVAHMWPEILDTPINPFPFHISLMRALRTLLRRCRLISN